MNSDKLKKIDVEITKIKGKITDYTARLRELERQRTETENAGIIALVRDMDILPEELTAFIQSFKQNPVCSTAEANNDIKIMKNELEDTDDKE